MKKLIVLLTLLPYTLLAMDPPMLPPVERTYPLNFQPMPYKGDDKDDEDGGIEPHPLKAIHGATTFEGMDVKDLQAVLDNADDRDINLMIDCLKDETLRQSCEFNYYFFVGEHGIGKTVLAKAIAHKVTSETPWSYEYISSRAFMGQYRNQTGVALRAYLKKIKESKNPTILIIDQLNKILEHTKSASDDTVFASDLICDFIDLSNENRKNRFFIGIMDRATELCDRLKSRIAVSISWIKKPTNPDLKRIIFTSKCINDHTQLHQEVTNEWLMNFLAQAPTIEGRNFRGLALEITESMKENTLQNTITAITKKHIESALASYIAARKNIEHIDPYESNWDLTERLHQEKMQHRQELHDLKMQQILQLHNQQIQEWQAQQQQQAQTLNNAPAPVDDSSWCIIQ